MSIVLTRKELYDRVTDRAGPSLLKDTMPSLEVSMDWHRHSTRSSVPSHASRRLLAGRRQNTSSGGDDVAQDRRRSQTLRNVGLCRISEAA